MRLLFSIVGGTVDPENRSTVALLLTDADGAHGVCSGTVIARHASTGYVLTAAHCVTGTVDKVIDAVDWRDCTAAGDAAGCTASDPNEGDEDEITNEAATDDVAPTGKGLRIIGDDEKPLGQ